MWNFSKVHVFWNLIDVVVSKLRGIEVFRIVYVKQREGEGGGSAIAGQGGYLERWGINTDTKAAQ